MKEWILALCIGYGIDLVIGDPHRLWHPVRGIGWLIQVLEPILRAVFRKSEKGEKAAGAMLVLLVVTASVGVPLGILILAGYLHPNLRFALECLMCYQLLATKSLKVESMKVYLELKKDDLQAARVAVSMIVGRDTDLLTEEGVAKAAIETVAENTSDGIIAPMLFMALFGVLGGFFYKAVNTMDSMVGYKNDQYLYFGRVAAYLDDLVNYIPARISAWLIIWSAFCLRLDARSSYKIFRRDRYNHASPNSAQTEAACAGALRIQLAGDAYYFGKRYKKKTIGDPIKKVVYEDIKTVNRLLYLSASTGIMIIAAIGLVL